MSNRSRSPRVVDHKEEAIVAPQSFLRRAGIGWIVQLPRSVLASGAKAPKLSPPRQGSVQTSCWTSSGGLMPRERRTEEGRLEDGSYVVSCQC